MRSPSKRDWSTAPSKRLPDEPSGSSSQMLYPGLFIFPDETSRSTKLGWYFFDQRGKLVSPSLPSPSIPIHCWCEVEDTTPMEKSSILTLPSEIVSVKFTPSTLTESEKATTKLR